MASAVQRLQRGRDPHRATRRLRGHRRVELCVRGKPPGAVDDDAHRQPEFARHDRRLQLTVAQLDEFGGDAMHAQVGMAGARGERGRQRSVGELVSRQRKEFGIDPSARSHAPTVVASTRPACDGL